MINLQNLLDDAKCYETVRRLRWPVGVRCPHCDAAAITSRGGTPPNRHDGSTGANAVNATLTI